MPSTVGGVSEVAPSRHTTSLTIVTTQEDIVRLTSLLDMLDQGGSGPWPTTTGTTAPEDTFDQLVDTLIPCRVHDAELWFAESTADVELAKSLCQDCPIRQGCLAGAVAREEPWGVWGGEVFVGGVVVARKRGRGRPRKDQSTSAA